MDKEDKVEHIDSLLSTFTMMADSNRSEQCLPSLQGVTTTEEMAG